MKCLVFAYHRRSPSRPRVRTLEGKEGSMDMTLELSLVAATLDCLHRRTGEPSTLGGHQHLRRAAEGLDEVRASLELLSREDAPPDEEGCSLVQMA